MKIRQHSNGVVAKHVTVKGKRMVMLAETDFERLLMEADLWEPKPPDPLPNGNFPAEVVRIDLAIDIIRDRRRLGLTQADLARLAGIRLATLQRVESGERRPTSVRTIEKIDRALTEAEAGLRTHSSNGVKSRKKKAKATA